MTKLLLSLAHLLMRSSMNKETFTDFFIPFIFYFFLVGVGLLIGYVGGYSAKCAEPVCARYETVIRVCDECLRQARLNQKNIYLMCEPQVSPDAR